MQHRDIQALRKRAFQYTRKRDLERLIRRVTDWDQKQINIVMKHRSDLLSVKRGARRRNGHPSSSHEQFIQTSLLVDGWIDDHLMSALAWSHDKRDDYPDKFGYNFMSRSYSPRMTQEIQRLSRDPCWIELPFRNEVELSDQQIRSGGERTMVVKVLDRPHNDLNALRITSERRRRKSGMKLWQNFESILPIAEELGYMADLIRWLSQRQLDRLGYTRLELDKLVLRPLDDP